MEETGWFSRWDSLWLVLWEENIYSQVVYVNTLPPAYKWVKVQVSISCWQLCDIKRNNLLGYLKTCVSAISLFQFLPHCSIFLVTWSLHLDLGLPSSLVPVMFISVSVCVASFSCVMQWLYSYTTTNHLLSFYHFRSFFYAAQKFNLSYLRFARILVSVYVSVPCVLHLLLHSGNIHHNLDFFGISQLHSMFLTLVKKFLPCPILLAISCCLQFRKTLLPKVK